VNGNCTLAEYAIVIGLESLHEVKCDNYTTKHYFGWQLLETGDKKKRALILF